MIIAENQVKVPGKNFKVKVSCLSTRRLTTIEWLLLSCIQKFSSGNEKSMTVKEVFEKIFQFQNSELLIKPCLKSLKGLNVIRIEDENMVNYSELTFERFQLTELGQVMLQDGLLPGETREIGMDIYYNPLTGSISTFNSQYGGKEDAVEFGVDSDYDLDFPKEKIIKGLQSGVVASGKFTAAKYRIEEVEEQQSQDWLCTSEILVDLDDSGKLSTNPEIIEETMYSHVRNLLMSKEITEKVLASLVSIDDVNCKTVIGSGAKIKSKIQAICKNSKIILMHKDIYDVYKKNTSYFKEKLVILFSDDEEFSVEIGKDKTKIIHIPFEFSVPGCILMNEKGETMSLCKARWNYKGINMTAPFAFEDEKLLSKYGALKDWMEQIILNGYEQDISYISLATIPGWTKNSNVALKLLEKKWRNCAIEEIIADCRVIANKCLELDTLMIDLTSLSDLWFEKVDFDDVNKGFEQLGLMISSALVKRRSKMHRLFVEKLIAKIEKPQSYLELMTLIQRIGIITHEDALIFDYIIEEYYTDKIVEDIIKGIVNESISHLPSLFSKDAFFNDYMKDIAYIEAHISGLDLFKMSSYEEISYATENCPDIASLQMYVADVFDKNLQLMRDGINVFDIMRSEQPEKATAFFDNLNCINELLSKKISKEYNHETLSVKKQTKERKRVFILDTCALIHNPKIFLFFAEDEYVRIPTKVLGELDKIKDNRSDKYNYEDSKTARMIAKNIEDYYISLFNAENKVRFLIENGDLSLLPKDLDPNVPDNLILSVALKYKDFETCIISDDGIFRLTSLSQNISAITGEEFIEKHREYYTSLDTWKEKVGFKMPVSIQTNRFQNGPIVTADRKIGTDMSLDDMPIRVISKYATDLTNPIISFLNTNQIKTIGQLKQLTPMSVSLLKAKGKQTVYRNIVSRVLTQLDEILEKIQTDQVT